MPTRRSARRSRGYAGVAIYHPKSEVNVGTLWRTAFLLRRRISGYYRAPLPQAGIGHTGNSEPYPAVLLYVVR